MENLEAGGEETSTLLNNVSKTSNYVGIGCNHNEKNSKKLYRNEVSPCPDPIVQAAVGEAKKRLKNIEEKYECAYKMYREVQGQFYRFHRNEGRYSENQSHRIGDCIGQCMNLVKQLRNALDRLNAEEATQRGTRKSNHSKKFLMLHGCKSLAQEKKILQQKAEHKQPNNEKLSQEKIDFKVINWEFRYMQTIIPRSSNKKYVHDLLSRLKETNNLREKAIVGGALVGNPTSQDSIKEYTSIELKLMMRIVEELKKEKGETDNILGEKRRIEKGYKEKMRHLQEKKGRLCEKWDDERKHMLGLKNTPDGLLYFLPDFQRWMH